MRRRTLSMVMRVGILITTLATTTVQAMPLDPAVYHRPPKPAPVSELPPGLTQTPDAALRKKIEAKEAAAHPKLDVRPLSAQEMRTARGRGQYRNANFNGTLPWQRSLRDVNLCNGNLFKSFTDIQVSPGRGPGLALQRTYNSNDPRVGPFGVGWTHAYDIRMDEAGNNQVPRTDFFGGKQTYHRDADGLYSPPPYLYDQLSSGYLNDLVNGPANVQNDTDIGMDGTVKHFNAVDASSTRPCDYIADRYGNTTRLVYGQQITLGNGLASSALTSVTDPVGRSLTFYWQNLGTGAQPAWRIVSV